MRVVSAEIALGEEDNVKASLVRFDEQFAR
jgi:hypothetical protein